MEIFKMSDIDCDYTDNVVCPYCGHEHEHDLHEMFGREDTIRTECDECGKQFEVSRDFSVSYSSSKIDHEAEARVEAEAKQLREARVDACRRFPPGTPIRVTAGVHEGREGFVENREASIYVSIVTAEGQYIGSADADQIEKLAGPLVVPPPRKPWSTPKQKKVSKRG